MTQHNDNSTNHDLVRLSRPAKVSEQSWPKGTIPLVSVICPTYNQEAFIEQCLQGFLLQETTFPIEVIIQDDASTDRTQEIIKKYADRHPQVLRPFFCATNQFSRGVKPWALAFPQARGAYIATCDGDDFWSLPGKLERQLNIFEANPDCILCGGRVYVQRDDSQFPYKIEPSIAPELLSSIGPMEMLRDQWSMRTLSRMAKRAVWEGYLRSVNGSLAACDWLFTLYCISQSGMRPGTFGCLDEIVGTYREHPGGIWYGADEGAKLDWDFAVLMFALCNFEFAEGREILESGFLRRAERIGLTPDKDAAAYLLYRQLRTQLRTRSVLRRIRNLVRRLVRPNRPA